MSFLKKWGIQLNYKLRNFIGIATFICIILILINSKFILESIDTKILGKEFVGIKDDKLYLLELKDTEVSKQELVDYIIYNFDRIKSHDLQNYKFAIYKKNINNEDTYVEKFRINIDENFEDELYKNIDLLDKNIDLFLKMSLFNEDEIYMSDIVVVKISDGLSDNVESEITLSNYSTKGTSSIVDLSSDVLIDDDSEMTIVADYGNNEVLNLNVQYSRTDNKLIIGNLVPGKEYKNLRISTQDSKNNKINFFIKKLLMESDTELQDYIVKIYLQVLKRYPTELEYSEILDDLNNNGNDIRGFLVKVISSEEFNSINSTPKEIVDSIYFLCNKKNINSRLSIIILDEFNEKLLDFNNLESYKIELLDKFLSMDSSIEYMNSILKVTN